MFVIVWHTVFLTHIQIAAANPMYTPGIDDDEFLLGLCAIIMLNLTDLIKFWITHVSLTCECLNLNETDDDFSFGDWNPGHQAMPKLFSTSTPIFSGDAKDDGYELRSLTPIPLFQLGWNWTETQCLWSLDAFSKLFIGAPHQMSIWWHCPRVTSINRT